MERCKDARMVGERMEGLERLKYEKTDFNFFRKANIYKNKSIHNN